METIWVVCFLYGDGVVRGAVPTRDNLTEQEATALCDHLKATALEGIHYQVEKMEYPKGGDSGSATIPDSEAES